MSMRAVTSVVLTTYAEPSDDENGLEIKSFRFGRIFAILQQSIAFKFQPGDRDQWMIAKDGLGIANNNEQDACIIFKINLIIIYSVFECSICLKNNVCSIINSLKGSRFEKGWKPVRPHPAPNACILYRSLSELSFSCARSPRTTYRKMHR